MKLQKRREEALAKKSAQMEHAKNQIDEHENKRKVDFSYRAIFFVLTPIAVNDGFQPEEESK